MLPAVLIVEDDPRCRASFAEAVRAADDLHLAGVASDLADGLRLFDAIRPAVLLVDIGLPGGSGIGLIRHAQAKLPQCEVMVVTVFTDEQAVLACIEAGATGYLLKDSRGVDIAAQIRLLLGGGSPISPSIARRLLQRVGGPPAVATDAAARLSAQELSVLAFSAKGYRFDEIAALMGLSPHTVETYVKRIYRKLQVHSRAEAVFEARAQGLIRD